MITSVIVKIIGAVYKIPLTAFIGAVGRGYFASAYNICIPIHAITMGAFPIALSRLISSYNSKGDKVMTDALKKSAHRMFFVVGVVGMAIMLVFAIIIYLPPKEKRVLFYSRYVYTNNKTNLNEGKEEIGFACVFLFSRQ